MDQQHRIPYAKQEAVDAMVDEMLETKVIRPSTSPWASPIVIVKKKDGSPRLCVDFRKFNKITIKDKHPLPLIEKTLDSLGSAQFGSSSFCDRPITWSPDFLTSSILWADYVIVFKMWSYCDHELLWYDHKKSNPITNIFNPITSICIVLLILFLILNK